MMELKMSGKLQLLLKHPYQECDRMGLSAGRIVLSPCKIIPLPLPGVRLPGWSCTPDLVVPHSPLASWNHCLCFYNTSSQCPTPNLYPRPHRMLTTDSQIHMMLYTEAKNSVCVRAHVCVRVCMSACYLSTIV